MKCRKITIGSTLGIMCPSSRQTNEKQVELFLKYLSNSGFKYKLGQSMYAKCGYLAGSDTLRAEDFNHFIQDDEIDAILCFKGGYGASRFLHLIDYEQIKKHPKLIVGFSDVTVLLNAIYQKTGLPTLHGEMGVVFKESFLNEKEFSFTVYVADKIVKNATELRDALKNQKNGEVIAIKEGTYNMDRDDETKYEDQTGFYFLLTASNFTLKGFGNVVIKSTVESENGVWASQNFVTIAGDNTLIEGITLQCKKEPNKVIEILGKDTTLRSIKVEPMDEVKFAGSIYLSTKAGNTTIENSSLTYGRITTSGASDSTLTLKNVTIDFANAYLDEDTKESTFWGFDNSRTKITVNATDSKVIVSKEFKAAENYQAFTEQLPKGVTVEEK